VEELTGKLPDALTSHYDQDLVQQLFGWRELPELNSNQTFVDYFRLASQFSAFMDTVQLLKADGVDVKCSILFHATDMSVIDKIIVGGFQNVGAANGTVCGVGAYNALFPYVDYTMGNNTRSGLTYINWNKGFGAVIVSIGVVVPSEYTSGQSSVLKSGCGTRGTRNGQGVCGGTFLSTVNSDGTIHANNREVVYWFDKLKYVCPLGIAIFKEG
jgi:hypothetical protein